MWGRAPARPHDALGFQGRAAPWDESLTAVQNGVMSIPTLMVYKNGQKVDPVVGAVPKDMLVAALKRHL